ncbi:trihelix transcription factor ENAP1 [Mercurialis annua]|uniref:trihelix transcription factor ENAP1 n=1 Tax=Mercurialis annua TaxID=3986 RepID=UPI0021608638|nr:trihelix transcription factor ENAP1 [Mercurialis annua]
MSTSAPGSPSPILPPNPSLPLLPAPPQPSTNPRRLPPPCWSHDETVALIDAYREKWYTLRRGNLKANDWQEVADAVANRCPVASPPKTSVQCRHKMEKLRQRYRTEIQRARSMPVSNFSSSWVHFKRMDGMEKGPQAKPDYNSDDNEDEDNNINESSTRSVHRNGSVGDKPASGFRIRIPTGVSIAQPGMKSYANPNLSSNPIPNKFGMKCDESGKKRERDPMVSAIKMLGDGFVRMEQMKMEMGREIERMRMDMKMKQTEMILESQHQIAEAFAKAFADSKKPKRVPSSQS